MKKTKALLITVLFIGLMAAPAFTTAYEEKAEETFNAKKEVRIKLVLGDCQLEKSPDNKIHVDLVYEYDQMENFKFRMEDRGRYINLEEDLSGKNNDGYSRWTVAVPDDTEIEFKSATGNFKIERLSVQADVSTGTGEIDILDTNGEIDVSTGTGDVRVENCTGDIEASSGTGNVHFQNCTSDIEASSGTGYVRIQNCRGNIEASSGTGNVKAAGITLEYEGDFSSGTGDAEVEFPNGKDFELTVASGTDDAVLMMKGKPIMGYFEFKCHARRGRIISPLAFDSEKQEGEGDDIYLVKSFTKDSGTPKVYIRTGTGRAKLVK
jgi:DUF4097 and DUF4098 domain-containing protein YvlB